MKTPLQVIADYGSPTDSYIRAVTFFSQKPDFTKVEYETGIQQIIGLCVPPILPSTYEARILFRYVIQETIRAHQGQTIPNIDIVYKDALEKTKHFIEEYTWAQTNYNCVNGITFTNSTEDEDHKGDKKTITETIFKDLVAQNASRGDIIEAFVNKVGMSKAGATTYFHSLKKQLGFTATKEQEQTVESKQQVAERIYNQATNKDKANLIEQFIAQLQTSKMGAQTYYYACKKKFKEKE